MFVYPLLSGEAKAEKRKAAFVGAASTRKAGDKQIDANARRKQIVDSLKEIETRNKKKKVTLEARITQAGLTWTKKQFAIYSVIAGFVTAFIIFMMSKHWGIALGAALVGGLGLPRWFLNFAGKRRLRKFTDEFPEAIDIIVRGVKAGLPLGDCLRIIANEMRDPIKTEFRLVVESQAMGLSVGEAVERLVARLPTAETSFFAIVIGIQQKAGGNLCRSARQSLRRSARPQENEGQDSGAVVGSQGLRLYHRRFAIRGRGPRLSHKPELHHAALDDRGRQARDGGMRHLDGDGHFRDEENGELRHLSRPANALCRN